MAKKYIDAEKLKSIIKVQIKERKEWMKDPDRSDRQDQLWSDLNGEDMSILQIITSLQQEQPSEDLEEAAIDFADKARKELYSKDYAISSIADYDHGCIDGFKAGAEWQKEQMPMPEDTVIFQKGIEEGKRLMMEDAVEGVAEELYNDGESQCTVGVGTYFKQGDEVYVIKKED